MESSVTTVKDNILFGGDYLQSLTAKFGSLGAFVLDQIRSHKDNVILIDAVTDKQYKASQLYERIIRLVYCLKALGVKEGDVIGISSENCFEFVVVMMATYCLNATLAPMNVTYTERELHHAVNLSKPRVIFVSRTPEEKIARVAQNNSFIKNIFVFAPTGLAKGVQPFSQLIDDPKVKSANDYEPAATDISNRVALIVCSSGTTGMPKGVQLTHKNIMRTLDGQYDSAQIDLTGIPVLSVIPWFHAFGCLTVLVTMCKGTVLVYLPKFDENKFLGSIEKYKVVMAFMVPPLMVFLAKHPLVDQYDLSSLLMLLSGAAPLSKETENAIKERIGVPIIRQGYGLSEATLSVLTQTDSNCKPGSVGVLRRGTYAKIIDPETGIALGPNQRGELCFKGDFIMKGYIGDKQATQTTIKDGWLHTGDIGYYDEEFEFFIVDRIKELIKYKGFQVPPAEIEAILLTHPKIKDAAVIGLPDEISGELPFGFVVKQANAQLTEQEVIDFVGERVSSAKKLRGGVRFIDEIPKNPSGKILRRVLRDLLKNTHKSKL